MLNIQETLQTVPNKIESAATEVEPMIHLLERSEQFSRIRYYRKNLSKRPWSGWPTCSRTTRKFEDTIGLGNDLAASSAGVPEVDDDELKDELEMLIEDQKKEEEAEKKRVRLEEKRKAEVKERVPLEAEQQRKAKEEAETFEAGRGRGLDESWRECTSHLRSILERIGRKGTMTCGRRKLLRRQEMIGRSS